MRSATVRIGQGTSTTASECLLGVNLETDRIEDGAFANRLRNARFCGPAETSGIARQWIAAAGGPPEGPLGGVAFNVTRGLALSGQESQMIHNHGGGEVGIVQTERYVRAGEETSVVLWARSQFRPATVRVGIRPLRKWPPDRVWVEDYDSQTFEVQPSGWGRYEGRLTAPVDDEECVFFLFVQGTGRVWVDQVIWKSAAEGVLRADFEAFVEEVGFPLLRFPGSSGVFHQWRKGLLPPERRPHDYFEGILSKWRPAYDLATDEYLEWCVRMGIAPHIVMNLGTESVEDSIEWARYCRAWFVSRGLPVPLLYWQIGNEPWLPYDPAHMEPARYADLLRRVVPALREAIPEARIIATGKADYWTDEYTFIDAEARRGRQGVARPWRAPLLDAAGEFMDVLSLQVYEGLPVADAGAEYLHTLEALDTMVKALDDAISDCRDRGLGTRIGLTEWNLWIEAASYDGRGFRETYDAQHVIFFTDMIRAMAQRGNDVELANYYCLNGPMNVVSFAGSRLVESGAAQAFRLLRPALPGRVLETEVDSWSDPSAGGRPAFAVTALSTGHGRELLVVNHSALEGARLSVAGTPSFELAGLAGASPRAPVQTFSGSSGADGSLEMPPLSVARVRLADAPAGPGDGQRRGPRQ